MNITVLGAGAWGTTLALLLFDNGHNVTLWEYKEDYCRILQQKRENITYLPGIPFPEKMKVTHNLTSACSGQDMIVLGVPTQFLRGVLVQLEKSSVANTIFVSISKGIEINTNLTVSQIITDVFPFLSSSQIGVLSGPSHAEEVSRKIPTTVVAASKEVAASKLIQSAFNNSYFRVYSSLDILGVELGGAFKNVIAVGAGIIDGIGYGDNTKAALMTRGIAEVSRLGIALGACPETFSGLSGIGDLIVTCMSRHSRNRYVGEKIGGGMKLAEVLKSMTAVAEGVATSKSASDLARQHKIEAPITFEVYRILFEEKDVKQAINELMTRVIKTEH